MARIADGNAMLGILGNDLSNVSGSAIGALNQKYSAYVNEMELLPTSIWATFTTGTQFKTVVSVPGVNGSTSYTFVRVEGFFDVAHWRLESQQTESISGDTAFAMNEADNQRLEHGRTPSGFMATLACCWRRGVMAGELPNCFPPTTLVATEVGLRPIAEVEAGQRVWSFDFETGEWRLCEVECRHDSQYNGPLVTLDLGIDEVTATAFHPFWVVEGEDLEARPELRNVAVSDERGGFLAGRWVNSQDVREGDVVFLRGSGPLKVRRVSTRNERTAVCNLTVRGLHTFVVGKSQVLVHNTSGSFSAANNAASRAKQGLDYARERLAALNDVYNAAKAAGGATRP